MKFPTLEDAMREWLLARRRLDNRGRTCDWEYFQLATNILYAVLMANDHEKPWAASAFRAFSRALQTRSVPLD